MRTRIGLISPHNGYNLGDGAIQESVIQKLKMLNPQAECIGITLYPADTRSRHGIPSTNLTGLVVRNYSEPEMLFAAELIPLTQDNLADYGSIGHPEAALSSNSGMVRNLIERMRSVKNLPVLGTVLRYMIFRIREAKKILVEIREFFRACFFTRSLDLVVVSGGGQLDEGHGGAWGHPYAMFRWAVASWITRTPFAIVSVGSGVIETPLTRWFTMKTLKLASYRSYRDQGTREALGRWHFTRSDPIVRDLAIGLDPHEYLPGDQKASAKKIVGVSPIYHTDPKYDSYERFVDAISGFLVWLIENDYQVLLYRTTSVDRLVINDIWDKLRSTCDNNMLGQVGEINAYRFQDLLKELAMVDLVVASRLHSVVLPHVLNKPTLAIIWDRKVEAHMDDLQQLDYSIGIDAVNRDLLVSKFCQLSQDSATIRERIRDRIAGFQSDIEGQYETLNQLAMGGKNRT